MVSATEKLKTLRVFNKGMKKYVFYRKAGESPEDLREDEEAVGISDDYFALVKAIDYLAVQINRLVRK